MQRSVLGALLPEAMICFLENYEPGRFAETFLGEFETPEAIWNSEMRRMMIEKIAAHIADFTPRLQTNTRATYQYLAIPLLQYPQLENELFCNIYYLKHLTDTQRYPDWPIKEPVSTTDHSTGVWGWCGDVWVCAFAGEGAERRAGGVEEGGGKEAATHVPRGGVPSTGASHWSRRVRDFP